MQHDQTRHEKHHAVSGQLNVRPQGQPGKRTGRDDQSPQQTHQHVNRTVSQIATTHPGKLSHVAQPCAKLELTAS